jgi:Na+-driven multidrug efflux pump
MEAVQKKKIDFTEGKVFFNLLRFILPIIATNLLQTFYNAADMMVVSLSSEENAVGAIGVTGSFIHLIVNVFIGFSVGANVVVAREIGARDKEKTQNAVHTAVFMALIFGVVGMLLGLVVSRPVLHTMGASGNLLDLAVRYTVFYFLGVPFMALTNYLIAIFRAKGDSKTPLVVLSLAGLLNVGLNLFFVLVAGLSVEGVAIATATANLASFVVLIIKLRKDQDYTTFSFHRLKIERGAFRDIVVNGVPAGIQGALFALSNILIQSSIVTVNNNLVPEGTKYAPVVNGSSATANIEGFVYTSMNAVYQGTITITSRNVGAKKLHRVKRILYSSMLAVCSVALLTSSLAYIFKEPLLSLYGVKGGTEGSLEALALESALIRYDYIISVYFLCGLMDVCSGVLRGMGKAVVSTVITLIGACLFRVVWLWTVFPLKQTLNVIFISYPISWLLTGLAGFIVIQAVLRKKLKKGEGV